MSKRLTLTIAAAAAATALLFTGLAPANAADPWDPAIERIGGSDRYDTAVKISKKFPANIGYLFIATGEAFPDALGASAVAGHFGSPLLLVTRTSVPANVVTEINRLNPDAIVIVGGTGVISNAVQTKLATLAPVVTRVAGSDRYATNRKTNELAYDAVGNPPSLALVATGRDYPDALAAGVVGGLRSYPVVLVNGSAAALDAATKTHLADIGVQNGAGIIGGTGSVSTGIENGLTTLFPGNVFRASGPDRFATSAKVRDIFFAAHDTAFLATGAGFADALAGGPLAASVDGGLGGPLYLVQKNCIPAPVLTRLQADQPSKVVLLGGTGTLTADVANLKPC
ncbi:putative cell wall-binding protein [Agromyces terreus]|uniref:Cell wall-binding protein n=1 Tax=Agromyces terreus TaxID=424795 RepID=A0A9X2GWL3_9MICO|nr:cell wall-binding repeat-containing protein [Agromyces terreus]MCP2370027.1 putative cell wall-binding protein [Agromyces terreus]